MRTRRRRPRDEHDHPNRSTGPTAPMAQRDARSAVSDRAKRGVSQIRAGQRQRQAGERLHAAELDVARGIEGAEQRAHEAGADEAAAKADEQRHAPDGRPSSGSHQYCAGADSAPVPQPS